MATPMELSLDDIITQAKQSTRGAGRGRGRGGGMNRSRGGSSGGLRNFRTGGGQRGRGNLFRSRNSNADGLWTHDKFQDAGFGGGRKLGLRSASFGTGPAKITISNLHFGVSDADVLELFGELGRIKYASVHYDRTGRSMGKADVTFEKRSEAQMAIQQYNGVPLDGRPMAISWASGSAPAAPTSPRGGNLRQIQGGRINRTSGGGGGRGGGFKGGRGGRGGFGGGKRGGGGGRGGGAAAKQPTAAELDAELDAYIKANPK